MLDYYLELLHTYLAQIVVCFVDLDFAEHSVAAVDQLHPADGQKDEQLLLEMSTYHLALVVDFEADEHHILVELGSGWDNSNVQLDRNQAGFAVGVKVAELGVMCYWPNR